MSRSNKFHNLFIYSWIAGFIAGVIPAIVYSKESIVIRVNGMHTVFLDNFFYNLTAAGNGWFLAGLSVLLTFRKIRYGLAGGMAFLLSAIIVQGLKHALAEPRPANIIDHSLLHFVHGVGIYTGNSFPSGHAATAFAAFGLLAYIYRGGTWQALFFLAACAVALSRVYLVQHFFGDVLAGSFIGIFASATAAYFLITTPDAKDRRWMDKGLTSIFSKHAG